MYDEIWLYYYIVPGPQEMKEYYSLLKDNSHGLLAVTETVKLQVRLVHALYGKL